MNGIMQELICTPGFEKTPLGERTRFWFYRLFDLAVSLRRYNGLPDSINRDYLETVLMSEGSIIWINDKIGKLRALKGTHYGFDCYGFPTSTTVANPVLGELKGTIGVNCVWMRNNIYGIPGIDVISRFAKQLAQLDIDLQVNLDNLKLAKLITVDNDLQAKQAKEVYKKLLAGEPAVVLNNPKDQSLVSMVQQQIGLKGAQVFSADIQYYGSQFLADRRTILNDFLTQMGINNIATEKKERLITDEVDINNQEIEMYQYYWIKPVQDALQDVNKIFGTNITVEMGVPDLSVLQKGDNKNGSNEESKELRS